MSTPQRRSRLETVEAAASRIQSSMTISIGGFINSSHPMAIVRQIIRAGVKDLTVIGAASSGLEVDMLVAAGCVRKVIAPYVGAEGLAPIAPAYRSAAQAGEIEVWEIDEAMYYAGLRAAAQGLPFNPWRSGVGTSYPVVNKDLRLFKDPIRGEELLAIPALSPQVSLLHASHADPYGNAQHIGTGYGDRAHHAAADCTVVQVERVVPGEEIRRDPLRTSVAGADAVVHAPFGAHPFASPGYYREDATFLREYVDAAGSLVRSGDRTRLDQFLDHYIRSTRDDAEYLERVGIRRLLSIFGR